MEERREAPPQERQSETVGGASAGAAPGTQLAAIGARLGPGRLVRKLQRRAAQRGAAALAPPAPEPPEDRSAHGVVQRSAVSEALSAGLESVTAGVGLVSGTLGAIVEFVRTGLDAQRFLERVWARTRRPVPMELWDVWAHAAIACRMTQLYASEIVARGEGFLWEMIHEAASLLPGVSPHTGLREQLEAHRLGAQLGRRLALTDDPKEACMALVFAGQLRAPPRHPETRYWNGRELITLRDAMVEPGFNGLVPVGESEPIRQTR